MSTATTAQDINKLQTDIHAAKMELGMLSNERESACHLLLLERVLGVVDALDDRTRKLEEQLRRLTGDGK
jgi:hypothetical protein